MVNVRRRRDGHRVNQLSKFFEGFRRSGAIFFCNRTGARRIDIVDGGELRCRNLGIEPRVIAPDVADADNANAKFFHAISVGEAVGFPWDANSVPYSPPAPTTLA